MRSCVYEHTLNTQQGKNPNALVETCGGGGGSQGLCGEDERVSVSAVACMSASPPFSSSRVSQTSCLTVKIALPPNPFSK